MTSAALSNLEAMLEAALAKKARVEPEAIVTGSLDPRLHGYQVRAVQHLHANPRSGLFMEMGLGKTASTLQALTPVHLPALVIAPKRVAENVWSAEVGIWRPDLSIAIAAGTPAKRAAALASGADIVVIGRDNIKDVPVGFFRTIVLDELSSFKNRGSQRWKVAKAICDPAPYVWGLTGTPSPNGLMDLWAQVFLIDRGQRLGRTLTAYRNRFFTAGRQLSTGVVIEWNLRKESEAKINSLLADAFVSMKSADYLELPPMTFNKVEVALPAKAVKVYDSMVSTMVADLTQADGEIHSAQSAAVLTGKLSQITAGFLYGEDNTMVDDLHDAKTEAVTEIVEGTGSPVLVFYRYKEELRRLKKALPQARTVEERGVLDEWNAGRVPVLLAHPASAGHGLNLQAGGHTIVWTTMSWSLEEWDQANARLARQGQKHPVIVHCLQAPDTIDEQILARLRDKASVQDALMAALGLR